MAGTRVVLEYQDETYQITVDGVDHYERGGHPNAYCLRGCDLDEYPDALQDELHYQQTPLSGDYDNAEKPWPVVHIGPGDAVTVVSVNPISDDE